MFNFDDRTEWRKIVVEHQAIKKELMINEYGVVYSLNYRNTKNTKWIIPAEAPTGYLQTAYGFVHRLVAQAFIREIPKGMVVNHKDGNKKNNHYSNLEIVTRSENTKHGLKTGLIFSPGKPSKKITVYKEGQFYKNYDGISDFAKELRPENPKQLIMGLSAILRGSWKPKKGVLAKYEIKEQITVGN